MCGGSRSYRLAPLLGAAEQRGEAEETHPTEELRLQEILLRRRGGHRDPRRVGGLAAPFLLHDPGRAHLHYRVSRLGGFWIAHATKVDVGYGVTSVERTKRTGVV